MSNIFSDSEALMPGDFGAAVELAIASGAPAASATGREDDIARRLAEIMNRFGKSSTSDPGYCAPREAANGLGVAATQSATAGGATGMPATAETKNSSLSALGPPANGGTNAFEPQAPRTLDETGLSASQIETLVLKLLLLRGALPGREIADELCLPFRMLSELLRDMKESRLIVYRGEAQVGDYVCELAPTGCDRALSAKLQSSYVGPAPTPFTEYVAAVAAQSVSIKRPTLTDLRRAFAELTLDAELLAQLGQAILSGHGFFLYGAPGNGKTSIAERVTRAFGDTIWIPRVIDAYGETIRLFDPSVHSESSVPDPEGRFDRRWVRIHRPTIVVGGELTMASLELVPSAASGITEASLQMKSNCGALVIDDFGRQRMSPAELLNRWIVPLEKRYDFQNLTSGRKICVPFDQLIVFSTNLEPQALVDEAFLRRIPYKIEVKDPSEEQLAQLFRHFADKWRLKVDDAMLSELFDQCYRATNRRRRFCHARDLLQQIRIYCEFHGLPPAMTRASVSAAAKNYFSLLG